MLNKPPQAFLVGGCSSWSLGGLCWVACDLVPPVGFLPGWTHLTDASGGVSPGTP